MSDRLHLRLQATGSASASSRWRRILSSGSSLLNTRMPRSVRRAVLEEEVLDQVRPEAAAWARTRARGDPGRTAVAPCLRGGARRDVAGHDPHQVALGVPAAWDPGKPGVVWGPRASRSRGGVASPAGRSVEARSDRASEPPVPVVAPDRAPAVHAGPQIGDAVVACAFNILMPTAGSCRPPLRRSWFALRHSLPRGRFCRLPCGRGAMDRPRGLDTL